MKTQEGFPWLSPTGPSGIHLEESLPGTDTPDRLTAVARDEHGRIIGMLYFSCRLLDGRRTKVVDADGVQIVASCFQSIGAKASPRACTRSFTSGVLHRSGSRGAVVHAG
jgi:hypothetical protein